MGRPSLSVILPNYNHAHYVGQALDALLAQSFQPVEIVVVDDASTDNSVEVISEYARKNSIIRLVKNVRNMGSVSTINSLLPQLSGDYVCCAASDDRVLPGFFEKSMALFSRHPRAGLCSALSLVLDEDDKPERFFYVPVVSKTPCYLSPEEVVRALRRSDYWVCVQALILRRDALLEFGSFDPSLGPFADHFLCNLVMLKYGACFVPEPLAVWRKRGDSYSSKARVDLNWGLERIERMERLMRSKYKELFPPAYVDVWKRRGLAATIYEASQMHPCPYDQILSLKGGYPELTLTDRIYFAALEHCPPARDWATRTYLFLQHACRDQARIAYFKFRRALAAIGGRS